MVLAIFLSFLSVASCQNLSISDQVSKIRSKCWDLSTLSDKTTNSFQISLIFDLCGQGSLSASHLSKYSIGSDSLSLEFQGPHKNYHLFKFTEIFPDTLHYIQKVLKDPDYLEFDPISSEKRSFCSETLKTWFSVLEAQNLSSGTPEEKRIRKETHGIYLTISWVYLIMFSIILARYFRAWHPWIFFHIGFGVIAGCTTFLSATYMYEVSKDPYEIRKPDKFIHSRLGQTLVTLISGEILIGLSFSAFKIFTYNTLLTILLNRIHRLLGYLLFLAGLYNCYVGWGFIESNYKILFYVGIALGVLLFAKLEIRQRIYKNTEKYQVDPPKMTHLEVLEKVRKGEYLVFTDEYVVNVSDFHRAHPGGSFMLNETLGEDSGKYLVGCSSFSSQYNPYVHSLGAYSLVKDLSVGKIPQPEGYLNPTPKSYVPIDFNLLKKINFNDSTFLLYFNNPDTKMAEKSIKLEWLGKHFMVILPESLGSTKRYYSSIFVDPFEWGHQLGLNEPVEPCPGALKLIVKAYPDGKVSSYLNNLSIGSTLSIKGPLGPGLALDSLDGEYVALAGGTGLVPFIDLVHNVSQSPSHKNFKLTIFAFFRSEPQSFCINILKTMQSHHKDWFELIEVYSGTPSQGVNSQILNKTQNPSLVWICGPSGFNRSFHSLLLQSGLNKHKIILM